MGSYTMPGTGQMVDDMAVIIPDLESATSQKILSVFQGKASLKTTIPGAAPAETATATATTLAALATTTTIKKSTTTTTTTTVKPAPTNPPAPAATARPAQTSPTTTVPKVAIEQNARGIVPPNDPNCQY
jgi:DNA polymerase III gamma/tau subunit